MFQGFLKLFANSLLADTKFLKTQLSKMVQLQGLIESILVPYSLLFNSEQSNKKDEDRIVSRQNKGLSLGYKTQKVLERITGSGITLMNNEIKDIAKVIRSLEIRGTLFRGTTKNIISQEKGFLNFWDH